MRGTSTSREDDTSGGTYVRVGQHSIYYEARGSGDPLLLIHGLSGSGRWWARNVDSLSERHRVYVVDLAGFGRSRSAPRIRLHDTAAFLRRWMDAVQIERASIVGHSMGGAIAATLAADHPDRVDRLIAVNAAALMANRRDLVFRFGSGRVIASLSPSFLPVLMADSLRAGPFSLLGAARDVLNADLRTKLGQISVPTLVVWGANDRLLPVTLGQQLSQAIPDARLTVIPRAGHNPMWDQPEAFNTTVINFLAESPVVSAA
jgi:pimeloyl-ACP methyl ester carboxylesterase